MDSLEDLKEALEIEEAILRGAEVNLSYNDLTKLPTDLLPHSVFEEVAARHAEAFGRVLGVRRRIAEIRREIYSLSAVTAIFRTITEDLLDRLRQRPALLLDLSPRLFEELIAERLERMGYLVTLTGDVYAADGGVDLIAVPRLAHLGATVIAGQVKHHSMERATGIEIIDRMLAWRGGPFHLGLIVTNTSFSEQAKWKAAQEGNRTFIRLRAKEDIQRWLHGEFFSKHELELPQEIRLSSKLSIPVPQPLEGSSIAFWPHRGD